MILLLYHPFLSFLCTCFIFLFPRFHSFLAKINPDGHNQQSFTTCTVNYVEKKKNHAGPYSWDAVSTGYFGSPTSPKKLKKI